VEGGGLVPVHVPLARIRPVFEQANQQTQWVSGSVQYSLYLRPLPPHESGCEPAS
jgi:hypothetical protein